MAPFPPGYAPGYRTHWGYVLLDGTVWRDTRQTSITLCYQPGGPIRYSLYWRLSVCLHWKTLTRNWCKLVIQHVLSINLITRSHTAATRTSSLTDIRTARAHCNKPWRSQPAHVRAQCWDRVLVDRATQQIGQHPKVIEGKTDLQIRAAYVHTTANRAWNLHSFTDL